MDIKSKNNKAKDILAALAIVMAAAIGYLSMYPGFTAQAKYYDKESPAKEDLWNKLCQSNYVLYKNIQESVQEKSLSYEDVYLLTVTEEKISQEEYDNAYYERDVIEAEEETARKQEYLGRFLGWEETLLRELYQQIDYCVIDSQSGRLLKNTQRDPNTVYTDLQNGITDTNPYYYFISMEYDAGGNLQHVNVTGPESDKILKLLQAQIQSKSLIQEEDVFYISDERKITLKIKQPVQTIFLYGITSEQWSSIYGTQYQNTSDTSWWREQRDAYNEGGAAGFFMLFLCGVMLIAVLMPVLFKEYHLQERRWTRIPLEAAVIILGILVGGMNIAVSLIVRSANNMLLETWNQFMPLAVNFASAGYPGYLILKFFVNIVPLMLLFGAGYWCATSFGIIWQTGMKGYLAQRSIIYHFWVHTKSFWKKKYLQCREELRSVDLSKNTDKVIIKYIIFNFILLALLSSLWIFGIGVLLVYSAVLFLIIRKYVGNLQLQYRELLKITDSIASGNLNTPMGNNIGVFNAYQAQLIRIQESFKKAVDEEVKSQKMKTELITNVSHDLKTPLTAIITYIDLLKEDNLSEETRREYLKTLENKSLRLKVLIEDLFEVSKADSRNIVLNPVPLDIGNLMTQVYLEYQDKLEEQHLDFRFRMPAEKVILQLDSQKTYRVFENLYINISKYAMPHTRVYLNMEQSGQGVDIELKNISDLELGVNPDDLTERFVRGDSSRNTEGSGLGLAIASSFVEIQGGSMKIEVDGDLFKVKIHWPWQTISPEEKEK